METDAKVFKGLDHVQSFPDIPAKSADLIEDQTIEGTSLGILVMPHQAWSLAPRFSESAYIKISIELAGFFIQFQVGERSVASSFVKLHCVTDQIIGSGLANMTYADVGAGTESGDLL